MISPYQDNDIKYQAWQNAFNWYYNQQLLIKFDIKRAKINNKKIAMIQTGFVGINNNKVNK